MSDWEIEAIRNDLLEVVDDSVMYRRRFEYYYRNHQTELEIILGKDKL